MQCEGNQMETSLIHVGHAFRSVVDLLPTFHRSHHNEVQSSRFGCCLCCCESRFLGGFRHTADAAAPPVRYTADAAASLGGNGSSPGDDPRHTADGAAPPVRYTADAPPAFRCFAAKCVRVLTQCIVEG